MATHPGMGNLSERMPFKTWVLKVSIHCEGCKKKVRKVIQSIEGVYAVDIDIKQHRVVVTGNVEGDTLVKKLVRSGKNAELWPQVAPPQEKKSRNLKKKEVKFDPEPSITQEPKHGGSEREKQDQKVEAEHQPAKTSGGDGGGVPDKGESSSASAVTKSHSDCGVTVAKADGGGVVAQNRDPSQNRNGGAEISGSGGPVVEPKAEGKKPDMGAAVNDPPAKATATAEDNKGGEGGAVTESTQPSESGTNGKKKKKKGQVSSAVGEPSYLATPASRGLPHHHNNGPDEANLDRPRHHGYEYPPHYYAPPVATVSYSTSYPTTNQTTSYYAAPPPNSYAYEHPRPETEPPPHDFQAYHQQPLDSFELFSDENPNGCLIM